MPYHVRFALAILLGSASAQLYTGVPGARANDTSFTNALCNENFANANAVRIANVSRAHAIY
jgi:hypothetical protein